MVCTGAGMRPDEVYPAQRAAVGADEAVVCLVRSRGAVDLALGETLVRLFRGDRLLQLCYSRQVDYARERLGVPARTMFLWVRLARGLAERPLLRRAVIAGAVTPRKALAVLPVAVGEREAAWTAAAMTSSVAELEKAASAAGGEPAFEAESLWLKMTPEQQDRLDAALALAQEVHGYGAPRWQRLEAICQEWLGAFGGWASDDEPECPPPAPAPVEESVAAVERRLRILEEALGEPDVGREEDHAGDAFALDARACRLLEVRRGHDEALGVLLARIVGDRVWATLGYACLKEYCRERLGLSARGVRQRVWLERKMSALPALRAALAAGRLTYAKALLVARVATSADVEERIENAACRTWQQTDRETTEDETRKDRAAGVRRLWGPKDAAQTVAAAIVAAQRWSEARGEPIDAGEALARVADHFVEVWTAHLERPRMSRSRRRVLMRHGGLCAVPGCSRPAEHEHHIRFRSHGGTDDEANRVAICVRHHLRGIHRSYLTVAGRAGERLEWRFANGEIWITEGDDDVRRAG